MIALGNVCVPVWPDGIISLLQSARGPNERRPAVLGPWWPCSSCVVAFQGPYKYWAVRGGAGKTTGLILLVAWSRFKTLLMHYLSESLGKKYINALLFGAVLLPIHQKYCFCAFFIIRFNITNVNKERTPFLFLEIEYVKTLTLWCF